MSRMKNDAFKKAFGQDIEPKTYNVEIGGNANYGDCFMCSKPIGNAACASIPGKGRVHKPCWNCTRCQQNLSGKMFGEINNSPHCESCLNKAPPPPAATAQKGGCPGCGQPCTSGSVLTWNEVDWHANCFKCERCKQQITGPAYRQGGDLKYSVGQNAKVTGGRPVCGNCKNDWKFS